MRSVRCDACGMKALLAASQCPHCGHLFEIRDSFGELLPLAHCSTCDSDYPRKRGECRWCGTKPEGFRIAPYAWKGAGVLAFVGMWWGAWLSSRSSGQDLTASHASQTTLAAQTSQTSQASQTSSDSQTSPATRAARAAQAAEMSQASQPSDSVAPPVDSGRVLPPQVLAQTDGADTARRENPTAVVATDLMPVEVADAVAPPNAPVVVRAIPIGPPPTVEPRTRPSSKASARATRRVRWVGTVARTWIPVRASANTKSRIVASIGPDTRVQLGEARGTWVRLRVRGLSGWVERRHFVGR